MVRSTCRLAQLLLLFLYFLLRNGVNRSRASSALLVSQHPTGVGTTFCRIRLGSNPSAGFYGLGAPGGFLCPPAPLFAPC